MILEHPVQGVKEQLDVRRRVQLVRSVLPVNQIDVFASQHLANLKLVDFKKTSRRYTNSQTKTLIQIFTRRDRKQYFLIPIKTEKTISFYLQRLSRINFIVPEKEIVPFIMLNWFSCDYLDAKVVRSLKCTINNTAYLCYNLII